VFRKFLALGLLVFLFFTFHNSFSTHIIGGELTYKCLGGELYELTLSVYTECGSPAILESSYPIKYYSQTLGISPDTPNAFNVFKNSTTEIQLLCNTAITNCQGGALHGVKLVVYKGTIDLSTFDFTTDWRFFWQRSSRSEEISTLVLPEGEDFFVEASLNNFDAPCNSSPTFKNSALATVCNQQEYIYNNAAIDPDGDVLVYSLITPKNSFDTDVVYNNGYDSANFLSFVSTASLDPNSGDLSFTSNLADISITDFKIEEYRNNKLIGWVRRGVQFTAMDCSNNLPKLSLFKGTTTDSVSVCAGEVVNLTLEALDDDNNQLTIKLLSGPGGFLIQNNNTTNPTANIFFATSSQGIGIFHFVVQVSDNVCPQPGYDTKTYTISVRDTPNFNLGDNFAMNCTETTTLAPEVTGGDGNYSYEWSDGSTTASLEATVGYYSLTVTDGTGCSFTDSISLTGEFFPSIETDSLCFGQTSLFYDNTIDLSDTKDIISWSWAFGDGSTSTVQNPEHSYAAPGDYIVVLTVTDNGSTSCAYATTQSITICEAPKFDFNIIGYCNYDMVNFELTPLSMSTCDFFTKVEFDFGDNNIENCYGPCLSTTHVYNDPGIYTVAITGTNLNGCERTITKSFEVFPSPEVNIIPEDFYLICSSPDSLIKTQIIIGGTGPILYEWNTLETTPDITINSSGNYSVTATDSIGCAYSDFISITYPLKTEFVYNPFCQVGDVVSFLDQSTDGLNTITQWEWDFGDLGSGANNLSSGINPLHEFSGLGDYIVSIKVTDSDGCVDSISGPVYNTVIDYFFEVLPLEKELCRYEYIRGTGPNGDHIDQQLWDFGDGYSSSGTIVNHSYRTVGDFNLSLNVIYNSNPRATQACFADFADQVTIFPLPEVEIISSAQRYCKGEDIEFSFLGSNNIQQAEWIYTNLSTGDADTINSFSTIYSFSEQDNYRTQLVVTDSNGCSSQQSFNQFVDRIVLPDFESELNICAKEFMIFTEAFRDTLENITDYRWDFGDGQSEGGQLPIALTTHAYETGISFPVTLTVSNSFSGCENSITKTVTILAPPYIAFDYDTICAESTMIFTNQTLKGDGEIESFRWIFPDGSESDKANSTFYFKEAGIFPVSLLSTSTLGCTDTLTQQVLVKKIPVSGIEFPDKFVQALEPMQFFDRSEGDVVSHYWDFGDGNTSTDEDPIHVYNEVERFNLTHVVTNSLGCTDTIQVLLDLNVYLELPNAFTPNNDGKNDYLQLIQQGIETLFDFKIYNRYGHVVFESIDVETSWDGTYNHQPQPAGVYVVHLKARGVYGEIYDFKRNVTLLR
jgi:gliding motility-associated-like protein